MGISLAPDDTKPLDPLKPKAPAMKGPLPADTGVGLAPAVQGPLPTEYQDAPTTAPPDRLKLATTAFDTFAKSTAPQYTADLRQATQTAAGKGQIGSGGLRTTYGNLANQRALALDTARDNLINSSTTASIGDAATSRGLDISQQGATTSRIAALGGLDVAKGTLGLETKKADTAASQGQQALDIQRQNTEQTSALARAGLTGILDGTATLAAKEQAVQEAIAKGSLTLEQGKLALAQLTQSTGSGQTQQQIDLAKQKQASDIALAKAGLSGILDDGTLTLEAKHLTIQDAVAKGRLTNEEGQLALAQLTQSQNQGNDQQRIGLEKEKIGQGQQQIDLQRQKQAVDTALAKAGMSGILDDGTLTLEAKHLTIQDAVAKGKLTNEEGQLALAQLSQSQQNAQEAERIGLAKKAQETTAGQTQQQIDLQRQKQATDAALAKAGMSGILDDGTLTLEAKHLTIQDAISKGKLTNEEGQLALAQLTQSQNQGNDQQRIGLEKEKIGQTQQQIDLQKQKQASDTALAKAGLSGILDDGTLTLEAKHLTIQDAIAKGKLTNEEGQLALAQLAQSQGQGNEQQRIQLAKDQLEQTGKQFGLSLAQNKELATLADKTQNRQIDTSSAQGQTSLALELARIMGAKDLSGINPDFLATIAKSLGFSIPGKTGGGVDPIVPVEKKVDVNGKEIKTTDDESGLGLERVA